MESIASKNVFVGLSGGVDSAVSAALLQNAGAHVTGVFIKGWYPPGMPCTWAEDRRDAMRVAAHLGVPFHTLDASTEYKQGVIDYLISEYAAGRTPNPDIMCNREVKFGAFYRFAKEHNADFIATGHYAQTKDGQLFRGIDPSKDQSYFLWAVPKEALSQTLFPVGGLPKSEVRALAEKFNLPVAQKKDSQGICFLGSISVDEFLRNELKTEEGDVLDETGQKIGTHDGAVLHTLGERITPHDAEQGPWYVVRKDLAINVLVVRHGSAAFETPPATLTLRDTNWFTPDALEGTLEAQYRYHGSVTAGTYDKKTSTFTPSVPLPEPIAAGQSLVLYVGDSCIGGGIIE
ncbi:MAG: tRNA-specific 2-thiouridylase [Parcubacteria bacterium C7867-008]|nr:MAG: tRNA-specific 2-thiouridylase [Parcubacteria bacterium C7867-008]